MMELTAEVREAILQHAKDDAPNEACGLIAMFNDKMVYYPRENICAFPDQAFGLDGYAEIEDKVDAVGGEIIGLVHSHPGLGIEFSSLDLKACRISDLEWVLVDPVSEEWGYCKPSEVSFKLEKALEREELAQ
jgi:proteasome lid subunit RPN8/RPN11